ncbi:hypothetical protein ACWEGQ_05450 [Streptomyces seoulensis]
MASQLSQVIAERAQRLLQPGERIGRVVVAQGGLGPRATVGVLVAILAASQCLAFASGAPDAQVPSWALLGFLVGGAVVTASTSRRIVLETDRNVVVLRYGRFGGVKPTGVVARLPRSTVVGPFSGTWSRIELAGQRLWVNRKWYGDAASFEARLG